MQHPDSLNQSRILSFRQKPPSADESHANNLKILYSTGKPKAQSAAKTRQIPSKSEKVLDAPELLDDFYLHLIDWSSNNHLGVALATSVFVWNSANGEIDELFTRDNEDEYVTSVRWVNEGNLLATGVAAVNSVELWDVTEPKKLRNMSSHGDRIATLDWNEFNLASGCRDGQIHLHDVRVQDHHVASFNAHTQEVCGLKWAEKGKFLASGGNDNMVLIWDPRDPTKPVHRLNQHQAAVKAVGWCPWQTNILATGGGTSDRSIKFWNVASGEMLQSAECGSQVSSVVWNSEYRELVSGHGYSHNQLTIWSYPAMTKVADLRGHTDRIIDVIPSPDGTMVASAAADETIRLWKVWPQKEKKAKKSVAKEHGKLLSQRMIR